MALRRSVPACITSLVLGLLCVFVIGLFALPGAVLNRGRGGFVHFGSNSTQWYWPEHLLSRLLFAVPTGIMVLLFGLHLRAGVVVAVMTWASLYVGWGCYMNIGTVATNYNSRSGFADWMIGRQEVNWTTEQRFMREYTGMSLRGLIWTAPQGYILEQLGFGWEYSLCGSLMGYAYYLGAKSNLDHLHDETLKRSFLDSTVAISEILWGWFIWFVLIISCLSQLEYRIQKWMHKRNPYLGFDPTSTYNTLLYKSLNRCFFRLVYDVFMIVLNIVNCCSLAFYSLVEQPDVPNKGQTFFGLFTAILCLTFSLGWQLGTVYANWKTKRKAKQQKNAAWMQTPPRRNIQQPRNSPIIRNRQEIFKRSRAQKQDFDSPSSPTNFMTASSSETEPLLSWPYSHPDRVSSPQTSLSLPNGTPLQIQLNHERGSTTTAVLILWPNVETWVYMDVFVWMRRLIGVLSLLCIVHNIVLSVIAVVWGWKSPRFIL